MSPAQPPSGPNLYFRCDWPAGPGQATVPQSILAALAAESPSGAYLMFGQYTENDFTAGEYSISETAFQYFTGPINYL
jgi:hypothetical protein